MAQNWAKLEQESFEELRRVLCQPLAQGAAQAAVQAVKSALQVLNGPEYVRAV